MKLTTSQLSVCQNLIAEGRRMTNPETGQQSECTAFWKAIVSGSVASGSLIWYRRSNSFLMLSKMFPRMTLLSVVTTSL